MSENQHKSGFVSIIGKPNSGKSTLLNALLGRKLVIATPKAQTTRHRILGILNDPGYQIVFSDTPGVIRPKYGLHRSMMGFVNQSLEDADLILLVVDVNERFPEDILFSLMGRTEIPVILVLNKIDEAEKDKIDFRMKEVKDEVEVVDAVQISALKKTNLDQLLAKVKEHLPEGLAWFDKESMSDRPERFFVSEIIREKLFLNLEDELPYSTEVNILEFEEEEKLIRINAEIHVDRKSQKGMVIGKGGKMIRKVGTQARKDIEEFLGKQVFLDLYVRVSEGWKDNKMKLKGFGYEG